MGDLLRIKNNLTYYYRKYQDYIVYAGKFIFGIILFSFINNIGNRTILNNVFVTVFLGLLSAILPVSGMYLLMILAITLQIFFTSIELSVAVFIFLAMIYLFYARIFPKESLLSIFILFAFYMKIPYIIPLAAGLYVGVNAVIPILGGIFIWNLLPLLDNLLVISPTSSFSLIEMPDAFMTLYVSVFNVISPDQPWIVTGIIFCITVLAVYYLSHLVINYARQISVLVGGAILLVGAIVQSVTGGLGIIGPFFGILIATGIITAVSLIDKPLEYQKSEHVEFEDSDNLYYVKVVPKHKPVAQAFQKNTRKKYKNPQKSEQE